MAVRVLCNNPQQLLEEIKAAIRGGTVKTWELDAAGDITHSPEQWKNKAWFRPVAEADRIVFKIIGRRSEKMLTSVYAAYHGHFIEMLLNHFDRKFSTATATALAADGDLFGGG
jgi:hypothetical protein